MKHQHATVWRVARLPRIIGSIACLALAACMGPRPKPPAEAEVHPPAAWHTEVGAPGEVQPDWWKGFGDDALGDLIARALANNDDLQMAITRVRQADALYRLARAQQIPTIDFSALGIKERTYSTVTGMAIVPIGYEPLLTATYDTDIFGKLREETRAARASLRGTQAAKDAARIAIVSSTAQGYVTLRTYDAELDISQATLQSRKAELDLLRHQYAEGYVKVVAVQEAEAAYHSVEAQIPQLQLEIREEEDALSVLVGDNPGDIRRGLSLTELPLLKPPSEVPAQLLRRRPDLMEAEESVVAADHTLSSARAAFLPDLTLQATGGRLGANLLPAPLTIWSFAGTVMAPIFEGGKLVAGQDLAAAARDSAAFAYRKAALGAFQEVEDALATVQRMSEKERATMLERDSLAGALRAAHRRFDNGYTSYLEVLDAEQSLLSTQLSLVEVRGSRLIAAIMLYQSLGGGWPGLGVDRSS